MRLSLDVDLVCHTHFTSPLPSCPCRLAIPTDEPGDAPLLDPNANVACEAKPSEWKAAPGGPLPPVAVDAINRKRAEREERAVRANALHEAIGGLIKLEREERRRCEELTIDIRMLAEPGRDPHLW